MSAIDTKLWRDIGRMRGQAITIALVMGVGIACFIALRGNYASLRGAQASYYERQRFADAFAHLASAPRAVAEELESVPEVARVETRIVESGVIPLEEVAEPIRAQLVGLPSVGRPAINDVELRSGRMPEPHATDEVLLLEKFASHHGILPGGSIDVVLNGKKRRLRVAGLATSPEYLVALSPGSLAPEPGRFAVLWLRDDLLAATFRLEGAFNDATFALQPGASRPAALAAIDRVLEPHGGVGAYARDKQASSFFLDSELTQIGSMGSVIPAIFLAVAALLINIVLSRLVHQQRPQIATLKAVGYSGAEVGLHFAKLVAIIGTGGALLGVGAGVYLGQAMLGLYADFFDFPNLRFLIDAPSAGMAVITSLLAAGAGAAVSIWNVTRLPPAEAMRPAAPARYRRSLVDRLGLGWLVGPSAQMMVRELERRPMRTAMSVVAISASVALMMVGAWYLDGVEDMIHTQFHEVMREDVAVTFTRPTRARAIRELASLDGVLQAEGLRTVPVRFHNGHHWRDGAVIGYPDDVEMRALRDKLGKPRPLPPDGIVLTDMLARLLDVAVGDTIELKVNDGERGRFRVTVTGLVDEAFGLAGHMRLDALRETIGETELVTLALLRIDPEKSDTIDAHLKDAPGVLSVTRRHDILERFREQSGAMIITFSFIIILFAATITIGVVYNNARVALALRSRDLASLRVLGFRRSEISVVLLGEMAIQVVLALPLGLLMGKQLVIWLATLADPETYRLPVIITAKSYAFAAAITLAASAASALLVRRKLDHLDLIGVLKTRE